MMINRRSMILGVSALALTPTLAHARAYGASGWMTKRLNVAKAAGKVAFHEGKSYGDNPYTVETGEFMAWSGAYATEFALSAMTPEQRAAYDAKKLQDAVEIRKIVENDAKAGKAMVFVAGGFILGVSALCAWAVSLASGSTTKPFRSTKETK